MAASQCSRNRITRRRSHAAALFWASVLSTACASQQLSLKSANSTPELTPVALTSTVEQPPLRNAEPSAGAIPTPREEDERATYEVPRPHPEHPSNAARTLTIAGYCVQLAGIGGLATGAVLGVEQRTGTQAASNALAIGGAVAIVVGTIMAASASPLSYGPPPSNFIELR